MSKGFAEVFGEIAERLKENDNCIGAWYFGSTGRGEDDGLSDIDTVFLAENSNFGKLKADVLRTVYAVCEEIVAINISGQSMTGHYWGYPIVIRSGEELYHLDVVILNYACRDFPVFIDYCRNRTEENIIFDKQGKVFELLSREINLDYLKHGSYDKLIEKFWNCAMVGVKFFKRGDMLRLVRQMQVLFFAHMELLRLRYDDYIRGSWCDGIRYNVPKEKQEHLKAYFTTADMDAVKAAYLNCLQLFDADAREVCAYSGTAYPEHAARVITEYINGHIG